MPEFQQVTIFGASGFIGSHLALQLANDGVTVRAATRNTEKLAPLQALAPAGALIAAACPDMSEREIATAIAKSEAVVNLIGILHEGKKATFDDVHVKLARRIARIAKEHGVKSYVHMSALNVSPKSKSAYSRSKAEGELAVKEKFPEAAILRPSVVFGAEDNFFNKFFDMARFSPFLPSIGGGGTKFQPVFVGDVANAIIRCLELPPPDPNDFINRTFELGGPTVYTFNGLLRLMLQMSEQKRMLVTIPWGVARVLARLFELLPNPPLTRDQIELLHVHSILANPRAKTFADLNITPVAAETVLPTYLAY